MAKAAAMEVAEGGVEEAEEALVEAVESVGVEAPEAAVNVTPASSYRHSASS